MNILEKLYKNTSLTFENDAFQTTSGVRQGGPESVMRVFFLKNLTASNSSSINTVLTLEVSQEMRDIHLENSKLI